MRESSSTKNYIYNTMYKVLTLLTPLITAPYLARVIGSEGVGVYSYTYSIAYNFMLVAKLGLINYGSRSIARARDNKSQLEKIFSEIFSLQLITTAIASALYLGLVLNFLEDYRTICLVNCIHVLGIAIDIDWLFYGLEKFKTTSLRNACVKLLTVISILVFVRTKDDLIIYIVIMALSDIFRYLSIWISFRKCTKFHFVPLKAALTHLKPTLILFVPVIATSVYRSMDKIMLGYLTTMSDTGVYENSEKIVYMLLGFITSLESVMMPKISNLIEHGHRDEAMKNINNSMVYIVMLSCAMAFGITGISERFIPFFYGEEFLGAIQMLPALAVTLIFIGWANVIRTQYIVPNGRDHIYVISTLIGAVINFIVNLTLIPKLGAMGAVVGTIFAELSVAIYLTWIVRKELPIASYFKQSIAFPIIGALMAACVYLLGKVIDSTVVSLSVQIIAGALIYLTLSLLFIKKFNKELYAMIDRRLFAKLKRRFLH